MPVNISANVSVFEPEQSGSIPLLASVVLAQRFRAAGCDPVGAGSIPADHQNADMAELADIPVLETGEATHTGSTPVIRTMLLILRDRISDYESEGASSILAGATVPNFRIFSSQKLLEGVSRSGINSVRLCGTM